MNRRLVPVGLADLTDADLVDAAADGDHDAFAILFRRHGPDVIRTIQRRSGSAALADDVAAAAFEKAWRGLADLRRRGIAFRPWVFRLAINELIDVQRSGARRVDREERAVRREPQTEPSADEPADLDRVRRALASLPERHQEVLTMRHIADLSPAEIAAALGVSKGTVAVRTHRATAALRRALENDRKEVVT